MNLVCEGGAKCYMHTLGGTELSLDGHGAIEYDSIAMERDNAALCDDGISFDTRRPTIIGDEAVAADNSTAVCCRGYASCYGAVRVVTMGPDMPIVISGHIGLYLHLFSHHISQATYI